MGTLPNYVQNSKASGVRDESKRMHVVPASAMSMGRQFHGRRRKLFKLHTAVRLL